MGERNPSNLSVSYLIRNPSVVSVPLGNSNPFGLNVSVEMLKCTDDSILNRRKRVFYMERNEWHCPVCGCLNYAYIAQDVGKRCKECGVLVFTQGDKVITAYQRKI